MASKLLFNTLLLLVSGNALSQPLQLPRTKHGFVVVAHRGDHTAAPENTLAAYGKAIKNKVDYVEIDLRTTKDSQLVIMHDASIDRMTGSQGQVKNMLFDSLRLLRVRDAAHPEWGLHNIPTFKEVLQLCKRKINIYLDFKEASVAAAYKEIVAAGMEHQVIVYINAPQQLIDWRRIAPQMPLMISLPKKVANKEEMFDMLASYRPDILDGNYSGYIPETVAAAKEKQIPIWADIQSTDEAKRWAAAIALGLDGLQTDHPKALIDYLKKIGKR